MIRTDSEPDHLSADDQAKRADSCGDGNTWWIRWVAQLRFFPITAEVTATAATGGDDPGLGGATLGAYYDTAPAGPEAQKVSRRPLQADQRSSDGRQLHNVDRATRSGIEVSTMPRPMTGTARASTSSAVCSMAAISLWIAGGLLPDPV